MDAVFKALADESRRKLLDRLHKENGRTLNDLCRDMGMSRQAVSKHLEALAEAGLVSSERSGRAVVYRLRVEPLNEAVRWMADVGAEWDDRLAKLRHRAGRS